MSIKFIKQYDEKDCGPTCIAMISQFFGKRVSIPRLREYAKTDRLGTNLYGLIKAGEHIDISLTGVKANSVNELKKIELPIIAHVINKQGYNHFIIIESFKKNKLHIVDPAKGKYKLTENEFNEIWTNVAVLVEKMDSFNKQNIAPSYMTIFADIFKKNYKTLIMIAIISVFINLTGIVGALYFKILTDDVIPSNVTSKLHTISLGVLILYIINALITYLRYQMILKLSLKIDIGLMKDYFKHVLHLPMNFFDTRKSGEILQRFMDTSKIREAMSSSTITLLVDTFMIIIGGVLLYLQSPILLFITILFIPLFILCSFIMKHPFEHYNQQVAENDAELSSYLIESFNGSSTLKNYQSESERFEQGSQKFSKLINNLMHLGQFSNIQLTINSFLKVTISLIILWIGSYFVINNQMTLGSLLAFNALTIFYLGPIERLINIQPTLQSSFVAARRIAEITDLKTEDDIHNNNYPYIFEKSIEMHNVKFQYGYRNIALDDINLKITKGQKVAIVGESGSGKSTIGKLLNHYYDVTEGQITVDQRPINEIGLNELRCKTGYVSQDTFLFADTISNNLLHGVNKGKSEYNVIEACHLAEAYDFIQKQPDQFNTMLEKEGANLSGGQAQRLSLARTFLKDPDIYIFDEATSALDSRTEYKIIQNIDNLVQQGKTAVIISHKLSTIQNADIIYTMKNGKIIEKGTHKNLLHNQGEYYKLWQLQTQNRVE